MRRKGEGSQASLSWVGKKETEANIGKDFLKLYKV